MHLSHGASPLSVSENSALSMVNPTSASSEGEDRRAGRASCRFLRLVEKPKVRGPPHRSPSHH